MTGIGRRATVKPWPRNAGAVQDRAARKGSRPVTPIEGLAFDPFTRQNLRCRYG